MIAKWAQEDVEKFDNLLNNNKNTKYSFQVENYKHDEHAKISGYVQQK